MRKWIHIFLALIIVSVTFIPLIPTVQAKTITITADRTNERNLSYWYWLTCDQSTWTSQYGNVSAGPGGTMPRHQRIIEIEDKVPSTYEYEGQQYPVKSVKYIGFEVRDDDYDGVNIHVVSIKPKSSDPFTFEVKVARDITEEGNSNPVTYEMGTKREDLCDTVYGRNYLVPIDLIYELTVEIPQKELQSIKVKPAEATVKVGESTHYTAYAVYDDGSEKELSDSEVSWRSSDTAKATVDSGGNATGKKGTDSPVQIIAEHGGKSGYGLLNVIDLSEKIEALDVQPSTKTIAVGEQFQYEALATTSKGFTFNVTNLASWSIANPSIATQTKGLAKGVSPGTTQITAVFNGLSDSATVNVIPGTNQPGGPVADFRYIPSSPNAGDSVSFRDQSTHPDGLDIVAWEWKIDGKTFTEQNPSYVFPKEGNYEVSLKVWDENGKTDQVTHNVTVGLPNQPPVACISGPEEVYLGDEVMYYSCSYDPDGFIVSYDWDYRRAGSYLEIVEVQGENAIVRFLKEGEGRIFHGVEDNRGKDASTYMDITILPPIPEAVIKYSGKLKVNRKVTLDASKSEYQPSFPIDHSKTRWTITPLNGQNPASIKYHNTLTGEFKDVLFKEPGEYKVTLYVENVAGYSDTTEELFFILPDEKPIADFTVVSSILRNPGDSNYASIQLQDKSRSPDLDTINRRVWKYRYDSDNDGVFGDESWVTLSDGNETNPVLRVNRVGKYQFELTVYEAQGEDVWEDFVTESEILFDDTTDKPANDKTTEVLNTPPQIQVLAGKKKKAQLVFIVGDTQHNKTQIESKINSVLIPRLAAKGIDAEITIKGPKQRVILEEVFNPFQFSKFMNQVPNLTDRFYPDRINSIKGVAQNRYIVFGFTRSLPNGDPGCGYYDMVTGNLFQCGGTNYIVRGVSRDSNQLFIELYRYFEDGTYTQSIFESGPGAVINVRGERSIIYGSHSGKYMYWYYRSGDKEGFLYASGKKIWNQRPASTGSYLYLTPNFQYAIAQFEPSPNDIYLLSTDDYGRTYMGIRGTIQAVTNDWVYFTMFNGGVQTNDLYRKHIHNGTLEPVISSFTSWGGQVSSDEKWYYFASSAKNASGQNVSRLYRIDLETKQEELFYEDPETTFGFTLGSSGDVYIYRKGDKFYKIRSSMSADILSALKETPKKNGYEYITVPVDDKLLADIQNSGTKNEILNDWQNKNAWYMPLGTTANEAQNQQMIALHFSRGTFINNTNLDQAMNNLANAIIAALDAEEGNSVYITLDDELKYTVQYTDRENDPQYAGRWKYVHDPDYFENPMGLSAYHNVTRTSPVTKFDSKGWYQTYAQARDNPAGTDNRFDNYRLWSEEINNLNIYVHEKPIAQFQSQLTYNAAQNHFTLNVTDRSYDRDHVSLANKGIVQREWRWQINGGGWNAGNPPSTINANDIITIQLRVKDMEGAWSDIYERTLDTRDPRPNAGFTISPNPSYKGQSVNITSTATHPNPGEPLTYQYFVQPSGGTETLEKTTANWSKVFPGRGTYRIRQVVTDSKGYSDESIDFANVVNRIPTVVVNTPASASATSPTIFAAQKPVIRWTMNDPDGDSQLKYRLVIYRHSNNAIVYDTGQANGGNQQLTIPVNLPEDETLYVQVKGFDGYDWSDFSAPKYFRLETNKPPQADFTWTPQPVWEGDTVRLIDRSTDPDGDSLTYQWKVTSPDGAQAAFATRNVERVFDQPGYYTVELTVSDGKESDTRVRVIAVGELTIFAEVKHTPEWQAIHEDKGHNTTEVPLDFYTGEIFVLAVRSSPAEVDKVQAWIDTTGLDGRRLFAETVLSRSGQTNQFAGELYDRKFLSFEQGLPEGVLPIHFQIRYANGVVKETSVPVNIIGNAYEAVGVHRRQ